MRTAPVKAIALPAVYRANLGLMAYINYAPMRIGTEDPWALTELAKAGGPGGGLGGYPHLGNLPLRALVCDGANLEFKSHVHSRMRGRFQGFAHARTPRVLHFIAFIIIMLFR